MDPSVIGGKLAGALVGPLTKKVLPSNQPGAGLVDKPVRLADLVSLRGEKRVLREKELRRLAERLTGQAVERPSESPFPPDEQTAVADALARRLLGLGDLDMDAVHAVRLGERELAVRLGRGAPAADGLSADACLFLDSATESACLHILEFFTQRSAFVPRALVEQARGQAETDRKVDELIARTPRPGDQDTDFEHRYLP